MKIIIDTGDLTYQEAQAKLGMDDNFDLVDSIIWLMDYGEEDTNGEMVTTHNGIKIRIEDLAKSEKE